MAEEYLVWEAARSQPLVDPFTEVHRLAPQI